MRYGNVFRRMCKRFNFAGQAHELTFSCYRNQHFLRSARICEYLADSIIQAKAKHFFDLWAYVFMPNHVHLMIFPQKKNYDISKILLSIKQPVSRRAIQYLHDENPNGLKYLATGQKHRPWRFWQKGGGYDRNITSIDTLIQAIQYIHNNPLRKALVDHPEQWAYSSALDWSGNGKGPVPIDIDSYPDI